MKRESSVLFDVVATAIAARPPGFEGWLSCEDLAIEVTETGMTNPVGEAAAAELSGTEAQGPLGVAGPFACTCAVSWRDLDAFLDEVVLRLTSPGRGNL